DTIRRIHPRDEGGVDRCPGGGVVFANRAVAIVCDKQIPSGQCDASRPIQPRSNEGAIDGCPGGGVVFANRVGARVRDKNLGATGYGYEAKRGNYSRKKKCSEGARKRPGVGFSVCFHRVEFEGSE